jgi:cytochrome c-type biogenesis protein CcmH
MKHLIVIWALLCAANVMAGEAKPLAEDEAVEQRMISITQELRCLVCQNESLAGSRADLAEDLRREVRDLIRQGKSDKEIMDFLVGRYGNFVRYRPPLEAGTLLLWGGPFVLLLAGAAGLFVAVRRRAKDSDAPLDARELERAEKLLAEVSKDRS